MARDFFARWFVWISGPSSPDRAKLIDHVRAVEKLRHVDPGPAQGLLYSLPAAVANGKFERQAVARQPDAIANHVEPIYLPIAATSFWFNSHFVSPFLVRGCLVFLFPAEFLLVFAEFLQSRSILIWATASRESNQPVSF